MAIPQLTVPVLLSNTISTCHCISNRIANLCTDFLQFLELLAALKTLPDTPEYEDDRTVANMKLMEHFKETNRKEAYIRHIHKLVAQHERFNNFTEAGEALLLHSKLYKWSDEKLGEISGEELSFPAQTHRERKVMFTDRFVLTSSVVCTVYESH